MAWPVTSPSITMGASAAGRILQTHPELVKCREFGGRKASALANAIWRIETRKRQKQINRKLKSKRSARARSLYLKADQSIFVRDVCQPFFSCEAASICSARRLNNSGSV